MRKILIAALLITFAMPVRAASFLVEGAFSETHDIIGQKNYLGPVGPAQNFSLRYDFNWPFIKRLPSDSEGDCACSYEPDAVAFSFGGFTATAYRAEPVFIVFPEEFVLYFEATNTMGVRINFSIRLGRTSLEVSDIFPTVAVINEPGSVFANRFSYSSVTLTNVLVDPELYLIPVPVLPTPAIPEPSTWALMIAGFTAAGAVIRRRTANIRAA